MHVGFADDKAAEFSFKENIIKRAAFGIIEFVEYFMIGKNPAGFWEINPEDRLNTDLSFSYFTTSICGNLIVLAVKTDRADTNNPYIHHGMLFIKEPIFFQHILLNLRGIHLFFDIFGLF